MLLFNKFVELYELEYAADYFRVLQLRWTSRLSAIRISSAFLKVLICIASYMYDWNPVYSLGLSPIILKQTHQ